MNIALSIIAFTGAAAILTITPGVDTTMVLRTSTAGGPRMGAAAAAGTCVGVLMWGVSAALGLTALLAASEAAFTVVKFAGAGYLFYLGLTLLLRPRNHLSKETAPTEFAVRMTSRAAFTRGLLSNVLNPKAGVFYISFLPQFIPHGVPIAEFSILLTMIHVLLVSIWFAILISATIPLGRFLSKPRVVRALDRLTGVVFVGFGLRLASSKL